MKRAAAVAVIAGIFLYFASPGLGYYFSADDVMNLRKSWQDPFWQLLRDCLFFWTPAYRPLGLLLYRVTFEVAGLHPLPFHLLSFALLLGNIGLLYAVSARLTGSRQVGMLAALVFSFHSRMEGLYFATANIYDVACFTFYFAAFLLYVRGAPIYLIALLYIGCLASKEMGATLPVILFAYQLLWQPKRRYWTILLLTAITAVYLYPRLLGQSAINASYAPQYTLTRLLETSRSYAGDLFYKHSPLPLILLILVWASLAAVAIALRSKPLLFGLIIVLIAPLPVSFVEPRGLSVYYIPFAGWALCAAALIGDRQPALRFAALAVLVSLLSIKDRPYRFFPGDGKSELIKSFESDVSAVQPSIQQGTRILLRNDPFDNNEWTPVSWLQLRYRDRDLEVDRAASITPSKEYGVILEYQNGHVLKVR